MARRRPRSTERPSSRAPRGAGDDARRGAGRPSSATIMLLVTVLLGVAVLAPTATQLIEQRQRVSDLQQSMFLTQQRIDGLQAEQARWSDPAYIQAQARGRLLFVKPGETSYLVIDSGAAPAQDQATAVSPEMHETESDWVQTFTQSVVTSGTTQAPAEEVAQP